ncbi:MAG TPA: glycosyltransferase family 39 protein [Candidatus Competibacteraceae bacterium]|nr:glycosyltransferase family 39 protein [Candidatus Competibacteraceae bacterium]HRZ05944.1 glycosyltransferase family 39 protein [Candidatus Competibacteraceae bacterium]HSA45758.1 glycosyltransferase family 39 protein [Candidatus Competibacteraceae bacterium]
MDRQMRSSQDLKNTSVSRSTDRVRFILVSLLGFFIDILLINLFYIQNFSLGFSHIISFITASGISYFVNLIGSSNKDIVFYLKLKPFLRFIIIVLLILFLRGGILSSSIQLLDFSPRSAFFICVIISSILNYIGNFFYGISRQTSDTHSEKEWYYFFVGVVIYSVLLRLFYLGLPELFYEEAYYWNYAKHLDIGYLDHPPLVAWIISLFTQLMGDNEFAIRFGAFICWLVMTYFSYRLAHDINKKTGACQAISLVATLPIFFAVGWAMTPDAPLMACWAAILYFLYQALIHERPRAWLGVGIAMGLGMLAKYTIILTGAAALLFILMDHHSRKWFFRPEPYLAIIIAIVIFSPVIIWNAEHQWASFLYQSHDRITDRFEFSLPDFITSIILILTPTGFFSVIAVLLFRKNLLPSHDTPSSNGAYSDAEHSYRLLVVLALFPVAIFALLSLFRETKFHWTGPGWLAVLPFMALIVVQSTRFTTPKLLAWVQRAWPPTMIVCLLIYGAFLHYLTLGFPGVPYPQHLYLLGWQGFGREIEALVNQFERDTGEKLLVVGMDRNRIASGLAFYRTKAVKSSNASVDHYPAQQTSSWHLFDGKSLMYEYWFPINEQDNKSLLLVSRNTANLTSDLVRSHVKQLGDIKEIILWKNGKQVGHYYYCLAKGYRSDSQAENVLQTIKAN